MIKADFDIETTTTEKKKQHVENIKLVVEPTHLKNISQNGRLPQIGVKIKNI